MAESSVLESWKTTVPCRFFANGVCREGDRCKYLHEENHTQILSGREQTKMVMEENVTKSTQHQGSGTSSSRTSSTSSICDNGSSVNDTNVSNPVTSASGTEGVADSSASSSTESIVVGSQANTGSVVCHFYQQGRCMFGTNCRNRHVMENDTSSSSSSRPDDLSSSSGVVNSVNPCVSTSGSSDSPSDRSCSVASPSPVSTQSCDEEELRLTKLPQVVESKTSLRVNAPEFIPSGLMFSQPVDNEIDDGNDAAEAPGKTWAQIVNASAGNGVPSPNVSLCPYAEAGECPYAERCTYLHGDTCEFCGHACLHPTNETQRKSHTDDCIKQHEREMELAFAVARSRDKQCGVCFEVVVDKNPASEQRFGILPNCNHCFCLACIRKWRQAKQFENKIIRACPECRVTSDFVCPSMYWVDTQEEKDKLITAYKGALSNKQCKYFKQGRGKCPFGNKCFYLHAYPDGTKVDTGPPLRRHRQNADGDTDAVQQLFLWDFLDERDNRWLYSLDDIDLMAFLSASDESDTSDIEIL